MRAVDLFAGLGGFSEGARRAGVEVVGAANHWPRAVELHGRAHPGAEHWCQDLRQFDFRVLPEFELLLAAPACPGHSNAGRGARGRWGLDHSHHDADRSTAWAVVDCLEACRPRFGLVENVPQFKAWELGPAWRFAIRTLGYDVQEVELDAADLGVPQNRVRTFWFLSRDGEELPQHEAQPWRGSRTILDVEGGTGWAPVASKSDAVRARVENGRRNGLGEVFLSQHVTGHPGRDLARPLPTITGADQMTIVRGDEMRPLSMGEYLAGQGFDPRTDLGTSTRKEASRLVGNAVAVPVAEWLCRSIERLGR